VICQKYRLDEMLGQGGMGSVWRATNLQLDCSVAIKLIRDGLDRDELRLRLTLEARAAAKLAHPSIVRVYDVGETETRDPFIVMELLHGQTLSEVSSDVCLSAVRAVQLLLPIAEALSAAHASGIVHRDLKPDNVFIVEEDGRVQPKLLDFGIAKLTGNGDRAGGLTQSGTLLGTPDYMSPEGARGQADLDARADVWSFCVVLYEQVAGALPFLGSNPYAMLRAIVEDDPIPLPSDFAGAAALWEIVQRGLAKDRCERFQSVAELGRALAVWLRSQGVQDDACGLQLDTKWLRSGDPSTPRPSGLCAPQAASNAHKRRLHARPRALWLLAIALLALAVGGAWSSTGRARLPEKAERPVAVTDAALRSVPRLAAPPAPPALVAEMPAPAVAKIEPKRGLVARSTPSIPVQRATSAVSATIENRGDARRVSLDLMPPY
jgi:eukaryotic-like serine/threonine-protein kinase